jgi:NADPH-dependent curcumin reductase CurA
MTTNRRLVLARRPHGLMAEGDVRAEEVALPDLEDGEALMQTSYLSIDPTVRT